MSTTNPFYGRIPALDTAAARPVPEFPLNPTPEAVRQWAAAMGQTIVSGQREVARIVQMLARFRVVMGPAGPPPLPDDRPAANGSGVLWLNENTGEFSYDRPLTPAQIAAGEVYEWLGMNEAAPASLSATKPSVNADEGDYDVLRVGGVDVSLDGHIHDGRYYTESEIDAIVAALSPAGHTHDDRYYTETETDNLLASKSDTSHLHDDRYYTETETNNNFLKRDGSSEMTGDLSLGYNNLNAAGFINARRTIKIDREDGSNATATIQTSGSATVDQIWQLITLAATGKFILYDATNARTALEADDNTGKVKLYYGLELNDQALRDALGVHMPDTYLSDVSGVPSTWPDTFRLYSCSNNTTGAPTTNYGVLIHVGSERGGSGRWHSQIWIELTGSFPGRMYSRIASALDTWYGWKDTADAITLRGVGVNSTTPTTGQVLTYNGSQWAPATPASAVVPALTAGPVATSGVAVTSGTYVTLMNVTPSSGECIVVNRVTTSSSMSVAYNMTIKVTIGGTVVWEQAIWAGSGYGSDFVGPDAVDYPDFIQGGDGQSVKIEAKKTGTNNGTLFCEYQKEAC